MTDNHLKRILLPAAAIVAMSTLHGCSTDGCLENRNSVPLAGFYDGSGKNIMLDSLRIISNGISNDSLALSEEGTHVSQVYLPMRVSETSTSWKFEYKWKYLGEDSPIDIITFDYDAEPYFASDECGVIYRYHIRRVDYTTNLIDSIVLVRDSVISNIDTEQIKIYFRTASEDESQESTNPSASAQRMTL